MRVGCLRRQGGRRYSLPFGDPKGAEARQKWRDTDGFEANLQVCRADSTAPRDSMWLFVLSAFAVSEFRPQGLSRMGIHGGLAVFFSQGYRSDKSRDFQIDG